METSLLLPIIDLSSTDKVSTARLIRRACIDHGLFYLVNHGVSEELIKKVFMESKNFFSLHLDEKMMLSRSAVRGYSPLYHEKHKPSTTSKGNSKEMFTYGSSKEVLGQLHPNKWPSQDVLPLWRPTMECYYKNVMDVGRKLLRLVALALNLEEDFFEQVGALNDDQATFVSLLYYPGELNSSGEVTCGSDAHSDFGMITLLATDGVPGLQVCRNKDKEPNVWEDVPGIKGAFVVNIGDLMERCTNGIFRSTMHRVVSVGKERYSVVGFINPDPNCVVECLESCCSETSPPKYTIVLEFVGIKY